MRAKPLQLAVLWASVAAAASSSSPAFLQPYIPLCPPSSARGTYGSPSFRAMTPRDLSTLRGCWRGTLVVRRLGEGPFGDDDGESGPRKREDGEDMGDGLSSYERAVTVLGLSPITILLALAIIVVVSCNALLGPGWARTLILGTGPTVFKARNLILPLDQQGFLFPEGYIPDDIDLQ